MAEPDAHVEPIGDGFAAVSGTFYRAVLPQYRDTVLLPSERPGRFTPPGGATLYCSATEEGTRIALRPYLQPGEPERVIIALSVKAQNIIDLRDAAACAAFGFDPADTAVAWREVVARGEIPSSWQITERVRAAGAHGFIDPSRKAPHLWHLALFGDFVGRETRVELASSATA